MGGPLHGRAILLQCLEELLPVAVERAGILLKARIQMLNIVGIAAVEKRAPGEGCVGILTGHARDPVISSCRAFPLRMLSPWRVCSTLPRRVLCKLRLRAGTAAQPDQPLSASAKVLPSRAGEGDTLIPAASIAAIFDSA